MKEIVCTEKSFITIMHICCIFMFLVLTSGILIYNRHIDIIFGSILILSGIYLVYGILCFLNVSIRINENGVEYKNLFIKKRWYSWKQVSVTREKNRSAAILFDLSGKKVRVYSYYGNYKRLNEWLKVSGKFSISL